MGLMRFRATSPQQLTPEVVEQAYLVGIDQAIWRVQATVEGEQLVIQRAARESASLQIPWWVEDRGWLMLTTGTLIERPVPYLLPLEIARGTLCQLRNQLAEWELLGLVIPAAVSVKVAEATACFARAAVAQDTPDTATAAAEATIRTALDAGDLLAQAYIHQIFAARRRSGTASQTLWAANLGSAAGNDPPLPNFAATFDAAVVPIAWSQVELSEGLFSWAEVDGRLQWCRENGLKVCLGPLLCFAPQGFPDWLCLWEGDMENIAACLGEYLQAVLERYAGKANYWLVATRLNSGKVLGLTDDEKVRLTFQSLEALQEADPATPKLVGFDQPWGEYAAQRESESPPLHFADAVVRSGQEMAGLLLELNIGYFPGGTAHRPLLEVSRQLDFWALFGLPLWVAISVPSNNGPDPQAVGAARLRPGVWTPSAQQRWVARYLPLLLAKPYLQGVIWNQLSDGAPHEFPHGGLLDGNHRPKPVLGTLTALRQRYLFAGATPAR
jgi:hypothetical protein